MPSSTPCAMPRDGSSGVDGTFQVSILPACSSNRQMSVKVPPESTPTRHRAMPFLVFPVMPALMLVGRLGLFQVRRYTSCSVGQFPLAASTTAVPLIVRPKTIIHIGD